MTLKPTAALLAILLSFNFTLAAAETGNLSFDQLMKQFSEEYAAGLRLPAPPAPEYKGGADDRYWVTVQASDRRERTRLLEAGVDIVEIGGASVSGVVPSVLLPTLSQKGYKVAAKQPLSQYIAALKDFPAADAAYHNFKETADLLNSLASKHADIASLFSIGKTVEKRDIWCLRINTSAKGQKTSDKPGAVFIGNHHAREHLSNEVPLLLAVYLLDRRNDPEVKKYISSLDIYIIPMLNGDGAEYDISTGKYKWHRKNTRVNSDKSVGVDLNRNYDAWFGGAGSSHYPSADTYCGPAAFSEPESLAIKKFTEARKNLKTMNSYHSYGSIIMYPWGGRDEPVPSDKDNRAFIKIAGEMGSATGYDSYQSNQMYVATGDTCDWAYAQAGIFAFTTELEGGGFYPPASIIEKAVSKNIKAALVMLKYTDNPYK